VSHEKNSPDSAKKALADYYDDVLGSLLGGAEESPASPEISEDRTLIEPEESSSSASSYGAEDSVCSGKLTKPAAASKNETSPVLSSAFAEPSGAPTVPTLAPPKIKPVVAPSATVPVEEKRETESAVEIPPDALIADSPVEQSLAEQKTVETEKVSDSVDVQITTDEALAKPLDWLANGRPAWAQNRFECLLFSVAGLKLAVPLVSLGSIHRIESEFTPLVGRADWFIGLYRAGDRNINVVDTAKWVMPRQYHEAVLDGYHFVIRLGDTNWGVACDSVAEAIQLEPEQVKWRTERSKRAWLSGTVIDHMCALLDAEMLSYLLQQDVRPDGTKKGSGN
jgi:purine-binding chemotaxis protein CheW